MICEFEGFRANPYKDQAGVATIGYGTIRIDGESVTMQTPPCTEPQARAWMEDELAAKVASADHFIPPEATDNQRASVYSFCYNLGSGAFIGSSLLHVWLSDEYTDQAVANHFRDWVFVHDPVTHALVRSAGLARRREAERALFLKPDDVQ